jgi:hypothetical protein
MTTALAPEELLMPSDESQERDRIDLRADSAWIARVKHQAERLGIKSISAYIRQATTRQLIQDEREEAETAPRQPRRKDRQ